MRPTHVEFSQLDGVLHVVRREDVSLYRGRDGEWSAFLADIDQPERISPETAARLRRELLGEPDAAPVPEPAAEPEAAQEKQPATIEEAATYVETCLRGVPWFVSVGVADDRLIVYTTSTTCLPRVILHGLKGWRIAVVKVGKPVPAAEPEFVLVGWGVVRNGIVTATRDREVADELAGADASVVPLYIRREDATP